MQKFFALFLALMLLLTLTACQGKEETSGPAPKEEPSSSMPPEEEEPGEPAAPRLTARDYEMPYGSECAGFSGGQALFWDRAWMFSLDAQNGRPDHGNITRLDLATGELRELGIWADMGRICRDGDTFYWAALEDEPRYPDEDRPDYPVGSPFPEYRQAGIHRGGADGTGELIYTIEQPWRITELDMTGGFLVWAEEMRTGDGGQGPNFRWRIRAMDRAGGEPFQVDEGECYDSITHRLRANDRWLVYWESTRNEETPLHLYDLAAREERYTLTAPTGPMDAGCDGSRLVWSSSRYYNDPHTLWACDLDTGAVTSWDVGEDPPESAAGPGLVEGRYVLYAAWEVEGEQVRLLDLTTGEVVYRSEDDPERSRAGSWLLDSPVLFDPAAGQLACAAQDKDYQMVFTVYSLG